MGSGSVANSSQQRRSSVGIVRPGVGYNRGDGNVEDKDYSDGQGNGEGDEDDGADNGSVDGDGDDQGQTYEDGFQREPWMRRLPPDSIFRDMHEETFGGVAGIGNDGYSAGAEEEHGINGWDTRWAEVMFGLKPDGRGGEQGKGKEYRRLI